MLDPSVSVLTLRDALDCLRERVVVSLRRIDSGLLRLRRRAEGRGDRSSRRDGCDLDRVRFQNVC